MSIVITGSVAYDYLMSFPGSFGDHIVTEQIDQVSLSFLVDSLHKHRGGCAPNIAYNLALLGEVPTVMATVGHDFGEYRESLEQHGPESVAIYGSGQWTVFDGYAASKWFRGGMRSNNVEPNARLCMASAVVGFITTFGVDEPSGCYEDPDECDTVITWGNNWAEMHPVLFSRFIDRRAKGDDITYIDMATRRTRSTAAADEYIEFVPQTDLAIANCICQQVLERGTHDQAFVDEHIMEQAVDQMFVLASAGAPAKT